MRFALARDVVLVGERYVTAHDYGWPDALQSCLDSARPGSFAVIDGTAHHPSVPAMAGALDRAGSGALIVLSMTQRADVGLLTSWRRALHVWKLATAISAQLGVPQVPYEGPTARAQAALLPPSPKAKSKAKSVFMASEQRIWEDRPHVDPESLGRLACGAVLKASQE